MTGPEFATAHGNDSTNWTPADFEAEFNLAEIDSLGIVHALTERLTPQTVDTTTAA